MSEHTHTLKQPITLPDGKTLDAITFPPMRGKYMRAFTAKASQDGKSEVSFGALMEVGECMLADKYGAVTARIIFDEMGPEDVNDVVAFVGEAFAGGQQTGTTA